MKHHGLAVLAAGAALLAPTGGAFAAVESFTHTITNVTDTDLFTLPAFDLALGTLESVNLTLTVGSTSTVSFANTDEGFDGIYPNAVFSVALYPSVAAPGGGVSLYLSKLFMTPVTFQDGTGQVSVSIDASTNSAYANSSQLGEYTGSSPVFFEFDVGPVDYLSDSDPNSILLSAGHSTTVANGSFTVSYI